MRTSWRETRQLEDHILGRESGGEALLTSVKCSLDDDICLKIEAQRQAYDCIRDYGRKKLREEIARVDRRLFFGKEHRNFRERILRLFPGETIR